MNALRKDEAITWAEEESAPSLRVHAFVPRSYANGPGARAVIWVQGCTLGCPGCFNLEARSPYAGEVVEVERLASRIAALAGGIEGVTVTGGEPLQQAAPVMALLRRLREETNLGAILLTGYTWNEVSLMPFAADLSGCVDLLLAGPYVRAEHLGSGLRGSRNKTVHHYTDRYRGVDLEAVPDTEVTLSPSREATHSGINPVAAPEGLFSRPNSRPGARKQFRWVLPKS